MADFYLKSDAGAVEHTNSAAVALAAKIVIARADVTANYLEVRKWVMECTTAGTTGATVPAWPATVTQDTTTVTDGTAVWTFRKPGFSSGTTADWGFSTIYMDYAASAMAAGDRLFVSNNHAETIAASVTYTFPGYTGLPNQILCVVDTAAPPTALATTAICGTGNGLFNITINGGIYCYGVKFRAGIGAAVAVSINITIVDAAIQVYDNCLFELATTSTSIGNRVNTGGSATLCTWRNCTVKFPAAAHRMGLPTGGKFVWLGGGLAAGSALTSTLLIGVNTTAPPKAIISGVDFTIGGTAMSLLSGAIGDVMFRDCKLPTGWTGSLAISIGSQGYGRFEMHNCDSADTNYRFATADYTGTVRQETTIVRTGGASDGTTPLAWRMVSTGGLGYPHRMLESMEIYSEWIETVGVAKTITVEIIHDSLTALNNDEVWLEVLHLGTLNFPLGVFSSNSKASVLAAATAQPASTVTWTTTGLTNPNKQKLSVTFTPQEKGVVVLVVRLAKTSYTVFVDPLATIT